MTTQALEATRRSFTFGISAMIGGLVIGLDGQAFATTVLASNLKPIEPEITAWIVIHPDDRVIIRVARSEMGQGGFTSLPMLVAEELECDWAKVSAEYVAPSENLARNRVWGAMVTAGSRGIRDSQAYLRKAGAQARTMLIAEAAARMRVPVRECEARNGVVTHAVSGRSLRYGEIAEAAAARAIPSDVALKRPETWRLIGQPMKRLDSYEKATGQPIYASDVRLPGMLHAAVAACPALGGRLTSFDAAQVLQMPGVKHVVPVGTNAVAVVATSWWQARKALDLLPVIWDETSAVDLSTDKIRASFRQGFDAGDLAVGNTRGDVDIALKGAATVLESEYEAPYLAHATMEPMTCTAHVTEDRVEVWAGTQDGENSLNYAAKTLGLDPAHVIVNKKHLGGGFGRRGLSQDWLVQAVQIAKAVGVPVKTFWNRSEDIQHDYYRPFCVARQTAGFDAQGHLVAWKIRIAGSSIVSGLMPARLTNGEDLEMMNAFVKADMFYETPHFDVRYAMRNTAIPVGFWRGVNHSQNGFFRESFIDEMAHARGQDPYQFRRQLLLKAPRSLAVLDEVARRADWGNAPKGVYQGIAVVECYDSVAAHVVDLSVGDAGTVKIHRVVCAVDCCYVVNPKIVIAQMEGAICFGLSAALAGEITFDRGRAQQSNFHDYPVVRMDQMPKVETYLVPSGDRYINRWGGIGEPGLPPLAPALTNAVFAATGHRVRSLPLSKHNLARV